MHSGVCVAAVSTLSAISASSAPLRCLLSSQFYRRDAEHAKVTQRGNQSAATLDKGLELVSILGCTDCKRGGINLLVEDELVQCQCPFTRECSALCVCQEFNFVDVWKSEVAFLLKIRKLLDEFITTFALLYGAVAAVACWCGDNSTILSSNVPGSFLVKV